MVAMVVLIVILNHKCFVIWLLFKQVYDASMMDDNAIHIDVNLQIIARCHMFVCTGSMNRLIDHMKDDFTIKKIALAFK